MYLASAMQVSSGEKDCDLLQAPNSITMGPSKEKRVIHISGSPGSGKTVLGQQLVDDDVEVIDTDELISDAEGQELYELRETERHVDALVHWREIFLGNLRRAYDQARKHTLIFTGILNHYSPDGSVLEMPFPNTEKYFIDLPLETLVRQFYTRYAKEVGDDAEFWSGVANGRYNIPGSLDYLEEHRKEKLWHVEHDYELYSPESIAMKVTTQ